MLAALNDWIDRHFPEPCPRCDLASAAGFCRECRADFPRIVSPCHRCAMPRPCDPCPGSAVDWAIDLMAVPFVYAPPLTEFVKSLKYRGQRRLGRVLGQLLLPELAANAQQVDCIVSVPLHPHRLRNRTFNQADEIAWSIARSFRCPVVSGVRRRLDTPPQAERDRSERRKFARDAFIVRQHLHYARIAIVDDVVTTGATVNALAAALRSAGARHVQAWAVARSVGTPMADAQSTRKM